ncbi:hypothetical protein JWS13_44615 [Rhodococcus pseudokoreensis]|uniref:Uncharacterized protein n=1 Tax=Rhodococcus pseudokoreensis TaxID=2811421 RepID=A0A974ZYW5_9NOCA|nr:hypothetical protein [Rhodococcus pseudokoreensis]QSE95186.1 hypothetical protein JWS13_44615 [Rhodococcus pseudokoreensis]
MGDRNRRMRRLTGLVHSENSNFFLFDDHFAAQASTIDGAADFLQPGQGVLAITTEVRWGPVQVTVEVHDGPPADTPSPQDWDRAAETSYHTNNGSQRILDGDFGSNLGELDEILTEPGPATVFVRAFGWAADDASGHPERYLLQIWTREAENEPSREQADYAVDYTGPEGANRTGLPPQPGSTLGSSEQAHYTGRPGAYLHLQYGHPPTSPIEDQ